MAKKQVEREVVEEQDDAVRVRRKVEYHLERTDEDGNRSNAGLVLHYPSEAEKVAEYLNNLVSSEKLDTSNCSYSFYKRITL